MANFTITQTRASQNLFLYPNANGCNIDFTPVGDVNNYQCVDELKNVPDDDDTYVYSSATLALYDLYELPNHTTETGTINYVQVYARGKSHLYSQHQDGTYKIIITDDACSNIYKSDDINLINSYTTYNKLWALNPRTTAAWTWDNIDDLQIGVECSSPTITATINSVFRPNAAGNDNANLRYSGAVFDGVGDATNYTYVDEGVSDGSTTYLRCVDNAVNLDSYNIPNHDPLTQTGTITGVTVYGTMRYKLSPPITITARLTVRIGGTTYYSDYKTLTPNYGTYSFTWNTDPSGGAWTWADIDNVEIGVELGTAGTRGEAAITQLYAIVKHLEQTVNPEIHTTQVYAKVNYTPPDSECILVVPSEITADQKQAIKMLNFWDGTRTVYGLHRDGKMAVLTGMQYGSTACEVMQCVRDMAEDGSEITLSGLGDALFNQSYRIISFGYRKVSEKPLLFSWILECEYAE